METPSLVIHAINYFQQFPMAHRREKSSDHYFSLHGNFLIYSNKESDQ